MHSLLTLSLREEKSTLRAKRQLTDVGKQWIIMGSIGGGFIFSFILYLVLERLKKTRQQRKERNQQAGPWHGGQTELHRVRE
jgi:hypothetical protein